MPSNFPFHRFLLYPPSFVSLQEQSTMIKSTQLPDCFYKHKPLLISPHKPTPTHHMYLSNLDDQKFLRFSIKYLYVYNNSVCIESLKSSLSKVLVDYYPLAGRLKISQANKDKLEVDCNGEGALFAEASMDFTVDDLLEASRWPNISWKKFLFRVEAQSFLGIPPLVIQVTKFRCGGMALCIGMNHCLCDGIGSSQFLLAWANLTKEPDVDLSIQPIHDRRLFQPRSPPKVTFTHPVFTNNNPHSDTCFDLARIIQSQPLVPICLTFTPCHILHLKKLCVPLLKCTSFEALASHTWRCWIKSLNPPSSLKIKLLFSANIRKIVKPEIPQGYYGNGFVIVCAETTVKELVQSSSSVHHGVKLVQEAKKSLSGDYVQSMIDYFEHERVTPDLSASLVISQWNHLDFEHVDFGGGKPAHMGPLVSEIYCLFLPVVGSQNAVKVLVSVPQGVADKFVYYMMDLPHREVKIGVEDYSAIDRMLIQSV